jgi:hypothetical protein
MRVSLNTSSLNKTLNNIVGYSLGFIEGTNSGKRIFLDNLGKDVIYVLNKYIDVNARLNEPALHHIYEWYRVGVPSARLFDLNYTVSGIGLSIGGTFKQSRSIPINSSEPFYNKAKIMEEGIPVVIKPKKATTLRFEVDGETVFTKNPVSVDNPGGRYVQGSFKRIVDDFMLNYFKQSFLRSSGIFDYLSNPVIYKKELPSGSKSGRSKGRSVGFKWITNARVGVE